jgi:hypothetical protein
MAEQGFHSGEIKVQAEYRAQIAFAVILFATTVSSAHGFGH